MMESVLEQLIAQAPIIGVLVLLLYKLVGRALDSLDDNTQAVNELRLLIHRLLDRYDPDAKRGVRRDSDD